MKKLLTLFTALTAAVLAAGSFTFDSNGNALLNSTGLLLDEKVMILDRNYALSEVANEKTTHDVKGKKVVNRFGKNEKLLPFRRELAISADGKQLELTYQGRVDAFRVQIDDKPGRFGYSFNINVKEFDGGKYYAVVGRAQHAKVVQGKFSTGKTFAPGKIRFLALEKENKRLVLDFNVEGVTNYSTPVFEATARKGILYLEHITGVRYQGETFQGKIIFYEGVAADYDKYHARRKYSYSHDFTVDRAYSFGATKVGKDYKKINDQLFNAKAKAGWVKNPEAVKVNIAPSGALYAALKGNKKAVFKVSDLKSGIYYVTLRTSAGKNATGKFSVKVNGQEFFSNKIVPAGKLLDAVMPMWIENGTAEVTFEGNWQVSTIVFQLLQTSFEDIKFRRGYWVSCDYEPCLMLKNAHYKKHPAMKKDIQIIDLAPHRCVIPADFKLKLDRPVLLPEVTENNKWRFNETLMSSGANKSKFIDFKTDELKNKELDHIEKYNGGVIILSGMLSRHTFPAHIERADMYVADFTRLAHKRGMKVFDHVDMPLLWNADSGFRVMCETTEQLQRSINHGGVNRIYCTNNPIRNRVFFDWAKNLVRKSDIDGMMVDEITFFSENFCGCRFCREKFTRDTGLTLTMDETCKDLHNSDSMLWKAWILWRNKSLGDWWVDFRKEIYTVKKEFSTLLYTTHGGWSNRHAATLFDGARAVDILGTEIMSRNVIAAHRPVNAFRKMKTALGEYYHAPIYGLVYPGEKCWNIAYFGWALNYMNRQTTWDKSMSRPDGASDFKNYKLRLDLGDAYGIADTAVVYSLPSILFAASMRTMNELLGISELLTDMNIMHDFVINAALTDPARLKRFKTIYVANARCLSDEEIKALRDFAAAGGTVYMSFHCGTADEMGFTRKVWPFKDIFGMAPRTHKNGIHGWNTESVKTTRQGTAESLKKLPYARMIGKKTKAAQIKLYAVRGKNAIPMVMTAPFGKGKFIYSAAPWGQGVVEFECGPGKPYRWQVDPATMKYAAQTLALALPEKPFAEFKTMPKQVIASLTGSSNKKFGKLIVVNLLNRGNAYPAPGELIPHTMGMDRGKVPGNIVFTVRTAPDNVEKVYTVSPDFAGEKPIAYKAAGSAIEVTVPGSMLKTFMEIRIKLKK